MSSYEQIQNKMGEIHCDTHLILNKLKLFKQMFKGIICSFLKKTTIVRQRNKKPKMKVTIKSKNAVNNWISRLDNNKLTTRIFEQDQISLCNSGKI